MLMAKPVQNRAGRGGGCARRLRRARWEEGAAAAHVVEALLRRRRPAVSIARGRRSACACADEELRVRACRLHVRLRASGLCGAGLRLPSGCDETAARRCRRSRDVGAVRQKLTG
eukprot:6202878-Pleurochrysis_carterae.AAC.1